MLFLFSVCKPVHC